MQPAIQSAGNQTNLNPGQDHAMSLISIVDDMTSLIAHVQASARLVESVIQRDFGAARANDAADVVILDDVTPCYSAAREALNACNGTLNAALQSLLGTLVEARRSAQRQMMFSHRSA